MRLTGLAILILFTRYAAAAVDCGGATPYDCAVSLVQKQQFQSAIAILDKLVVQSPQDLKALNLLGIALTGAGQIEKANTTLRQALKINPRFYPAWKTL